VEDTTDWKHATTRNIVMQADPQLTRTVLVTTKLDTKLPQFSEAEDLQDFLQAPLVHTLFSQLMGGPFFTSVPSGRVGVSKDYDTNEAFVAAVKGAEQNDRAVTVSKMGASQARPALLNVGVSKLRSFLEARVEDCYRRNVAKIVPLLQSELRAAEGKLAEVDAELRGLSFEHLRQTANEYREKFAKELASAIQGKSFQCYIYCAVVFCLYVALDGKVTYINIRPTRYNPPPPYKYTHLLTLLLAPTDIVHVPTVSVNAHTVLPLLTGSVKASPMEWGETLEIEAAKSGSSFLQQSELQSEAWRRVVEDEVGNNNQKLYGGAQVSAECWSLYVCERGLWVAELTRNFEKRAKCTRPLLGSVTVLCLSDRSAGCNVWLFLTLYSAVCLLILTVPPEYARVHRGGAAHGGPGGDRGRDRQRCR
jgi:hypothetical protein